MFYFYSLSRGDAGVRANRARDKTLYATEVYRTYNTHISSYSGSQQSTLCIESNDAAATHRQILTSTMTSKGMERHHVPLQKIICSGRARRCWPGPEFVEAQTGSD